MQRVIDHDGALVLYIPNWLQSTVGLYDMLKDNLTWCQPEVTVWKNRTKVPRYQSSCGDDESGAYRYSGSNIPLKCWYSNNPITNEFICLDYMRQVRDWIVADPSISVPTNGFTPNSCLVNYYRNGDDVVGYHSDKEMRDQLQSVVTISLGCSRRFKFRNKATKKTTHSMTLNEGDLVLMCGTT